MGRSNKKNSDIEEEYVVESILDVKFEGKKKLYKIKWEGYSVNECTWEPSTHLNSSLIKKYERSLSKGIPFSEVVSDGNSAEESADEPQMKEILESRREGGELQYYIEFSDGSTKWILSSQVVNTSLVKNYEVKKTKISSRKRIKTSSETESDDDVTSKKRNQNVSHDSFVQKTPVHRNSNARRSHRNSNVSTTNQSSVCGESVDAPLTIFDKSSKSKSNTPIVFKSKTKRNSSSRKSTTSNLNKSMTLHKSSSTKKREKQKPKNKKKEEEVEEVEEIYNIEKIVDHRVTNGVKEFRVRWENYPPEEDTWQTVDTFDDPNFVAEYEKLASEEFKKLRMVSDTDEGSNKTDDNFLKTLMDKARKGITYRDEEITGILSKHFNNDGDGFYLVRLASNEVIYMYPHDVPVTFRTECLYADKKRILGG